MALYGSIPSASVRATATTANAFVASAMLRQFETELLGMSVADQVNQPSGTASSSSVAFLNQSQQKCEHNYHKSSECYKCLGIKCSKCIKAGATGNAQIHKQGSKTCDKVFKRLSEKNAGGLAMLASGSQSESVSLNPENGTTDHHITSKAVFELYHRKQVPITCANGSTVFTDGQGSVHLGPILLGKAYHTPEMIESLLSINQLCKDKYQVLFTDEAVQILPRSAVVIGDPLVCGRRNFNRWLIDLPVPSSTPSMAHAAITHANELLAWHYRFCHLNDRDLKATLSHAGIKIDQDISLPDCLPCMLGKATKSPSTGTIPRAKHPGEGLDVDTLQINPPTFDGYHYAFSISDEASKAIFVKLLRHKNEAYDTIIAFLTYAQTHFGRNVKTLRADNEFDIPVIQQALCSAQLYAQVYT